MCAIVCYVGECDISHLAIYATGPQELLLRVLQLWCSWINGSQAWSVPKKTTAYAYLLITPYNIHLIFHHTLHLFYFSFTDTMDNTSSIEASKDPGIFKPRYTEQDFEG